MPIAIPSLLLCFAATVLLVFVSVSSPTWENISFLDVGDTRYGVFGHTGSDISIGYQFVDAGLGISTEITDNLTKILILHPIAAGLAGLSVVFLWHDAIRSISAVLATIATLVAFAIDMTLFSIARNRFRDEGIPAQYGNANWLTLGALVALLLGFCVGARGYTGGGGGGSSGGRHPSWPPTTSTNNYISTVTVPRFGTDRV